jgi:hypothetical protein
MAVTKLAPNKQVRRIVPVEYKRAALPFDITINAKGATFRRPGQTTRTKLFAPWHVILQNVRDVGKGYRCWSIEEAYGHLADPTPTPEACPCCGEAPRRRRKK